MHEVFVGHPRSKPAPYNIVCLGPSDCLPVMRIGSNAGGSLRHQGCKSEGETSPHSPLVILFVHSFTKITIRGPPGLVEKESCRQLVI